MRREFSQNPLWQNGPESEVDVAIEGLERYLMSKVHERAFAPPEDIERDKALHRRIAALQFIQKHHLDIKTPDSSIDDVSFTMAQEGASS